MEEDGKEGADAEETCEAEVDTARVENEVDRETKGGGEVDEERTLTGRKVVLVKRQKLIPVSIGSPGDFFRRIFEANITNNTHSGSQDKPWTGNKKNGEALVKIYYVSPAAAVLICARVI